VLVVVSLIMTKRLLALLFFILQVSLVASTTTEKRNGDSADKECTPHQFDEAKNKLHCLTLQKARAHRDVVGALQVSSLADLVNLAHRPTEALATTASSCHGNSHLNFW
jgi:hypothetical protein